MSKILTLPEVLLKTGECRQACLVDL
jgi:hypothetical protein